MVKHLTETDNNISYRYTEEESLKLIELFKTLRTKEIRYVVLRGFDLLPYQCISAGTNDIDILVDYEKIDVAVSSIISVGFFKQEQNKNLKSKLALLRQLASRIIRNLRSPVKFIGKLRSKALKLMKKIYQKSVAKNEVLSAEKISTIYSIVTKQIPFVFKNIKIDLWEHLGHQSLEIENYYRVDVNIEREILESRLLMNNLFYIPSPPYELAHLVNRIILDKKGKVPAYYRKRIGELVGILIQNGEYRDCFKSNLERTYFEAGDLVMQKALRGDLDTIRKSLLQFQDY